MLRRLRGMFAFAIWDRNRRRLLLGARPLRPEAALLHRSRRAASPSPRRSRPSWPTTRAWRSCRRARSISTSPFDSCSRPRRSSPRIRALPPAHYMVWEDGRARIERYWQLDLRAQVDVTARRSCWSGSTHSSAETVTAHLLSDVPVGAFLSGGLDSTLVASYAARVLGSELRTFSMGIPYRDLNELPAARGRRGSLRDPALRGGSHADGGARPAATGRRARRAGGPALHVPAAPGEDDRARGEGGAGRRRRRRAVRRLRPLLGRPVARRSTGRCPRWCAIWSPARCSVDCRTSSPSRASPTSSAGWTRWPGRPGASATRRACSSSGSTRPHRSELYTPEFRRRLAEQPAGRLHPRPLRERAGRGAGGPDDVRGRRPRDCRASRS